MGCSFISGIQHALGQVAQNPIVKAVAPIVAGYFLGPIAGGLFTSATGVAVSAGVGGALAGAATGGALAAATGQSVLGGLASGAMGGYGGGAMGAPGGLLAPTSITPQEAGVASQSFFAGGEVPTGAYYQVLANGGTASEASAAMAAYGGEAITGTPLQSTWDKVANLATSRGGMQLIGAGLGAVAGGNRNPATTTVNATKNLSPNEQRLRDLQVGEAERVYNNAVAAEIRNGNPNAAVAPQSPDTIAAQNALRAYATGSATTQANHMASAVDYGLTGAMDVANNPYLDSAIKAAIKPMYNSFMDPGGTLSGIRSDAVGSGQYGGTRQGLGEGVAVGRFNDTVGNVASKMASDAYTTGQSTFAKTLSLAPQTLAAGQAPAQMLGNIGLQNEVQQQKVNQFESDRKLWEMNRGAAPLKTFTSMTSGLENPQQLTSTTVPAPRRSLLGDVTAGATVANDIWNSFNPKPA